MRDHPQHEDLGLDPEADRTEDLRPQKSEDPGVAAPRSSVPNTHQMSERDSIMSQPTDDNATTWRQLADALTPDQITYIENWESRPDEPPNADGSPRSYDDHQRGLLYTAREFVGQNAAAALFADVAPPPEDGQHYHWEHGGDGQWTRYFAGTVRDIDKAAVIINGFQSSDGTITRSICVDGETDDLDAAKARRIAAALIEAADELERLANG